MNTVIRRYKNASRLIDELSRKPNEVEQLLSSVPGFIAYHGIRSGDSLVTITICRDAEGTAESTRRAADWVRKNLPADAITAPEISDGDAFLSFTAAGATSTQAHLADTLTSRPTTRGAQA